MKETTVGIAEAAGKQNTNDFTPLDVFGLEIAKKRKEAIEGRHLLGIEDEWLEDEEHYIGVDDANRHEYRSTWRNTKPSASGKWSTEDETKQKKSTTSTAFVNITRPYVDAAAARLADMLLSNTDEPFYGVEPTPIPELEDMVDSEDMIDLPPDPAGVVTKMPEGAWAQMMLEEAKDRAEKGELRIKDWFAEGKVVPRLRMVIEDAANIGTGIIKGPVPEKKRTKDRSGKVVDENIPVSKRVDPWNFYPDPACGEDIQDGNYVFERDSMTEKRLNELKRKPGYIPEQIDACIAEGPIAPEANWTPSTEVERLSTTTKTKYEIWYYTGIVSREELEAANYDFGRQEGEDDKEEGFKKEIRSEYFNAIVTMVNHRVIKAVLAPLDDGTFPYDVLVWQRRPGMWPGIGVSRQMRIPQRMLNAAVRNMMDNAGLSAGGQVVIDSRLVQPADGVWELRPRKIWIRTDDSDIEFDVKKAFDVVTIDSRQNELMVIIQFALRMAEESTGLPMIMQGQMGEKNKTDKVGIAQILNNNGSTVLRRLAKNFDESITIPHVTRYYEWLMEYGEDEEKGDHQIVARGSSVLVERDLQNMEMLAMVQLSKDPAYGWDPKKVAAEFARSRRFDPAKFEIDEEELAKMQPLPDPKVEIEGMRLEDKAAEREHESLENEKDRDLELETTLIETNSENSRFNAESVLKQQEGSGI